VYPDCDWSPTCQMIVADDGLVPIPLIRLHSVALQSFISETITDGMTAAICHLVCSACFGTSMLPLDVIQSVPLHDTYIVLLTARLVFRIGSVHQVLLSSLLSVIVQARPQLGPSALPVTTAQMRRIITNLSTRTALASAMPTPRPTELGTQHAYLYLEDAMAHALGLQPTSSIILDKYQRLVNSSQGLVCLEGARQAYSALPQHGLDELVCMLTFWFDGWDPNSSLCKANKTPIWSGTVTMIFATLQGDVQYVTTRVVSSGPGKADHTEVIAALLDNLLLLQQKVGDHKYWVRATSGHALVYPIVMLITCDQPERRTIAGLLAGNSKIHACFGVSCVTALLAKSLEACLDCVAALEAYVGAQDYRIPFERHCTRCLHWTLPVDIGAMPQYQYSTPVDKYFPTNVVVGKYLNTHAGILTSTILKGAWDEAFCKWVTEGTWTNKDVEAYFKVLTINDATATRFIEQGRRCQLAKVMHETPLAVGDAAQRLELGKRMRLYPGQYVKPVPPPMWSLAEMHQMPEAVMHLAMGVTKSIAKFIHQWAAARNQSPYLADRLNFCINMHGQYCRIGRCPMATYSPHGKFPGWVADTFRTWWMWMPWFYSILDNPRFGYVNYVWPARSPDKWNHQERLHFLKSRASPGYNKLRAQDSKDVLRSMMEADDWPQPEVIPGACAVDVNDLQRLAYYCQTLFKHLFAEPQTLADFQAATCHAKLLLSMITKLDRLMHPKDSLPNLYEVKYNFISLTRAVSLLAVYGSARNIQEGGTDGEGVVKMLRPLTPRGLKQHFARNLMNAYHRDQQLQELSEDIATAHAPVRVCTAYERANLDRLLQLEETELSACDNYHEPEPALLDEVVLDTPNDLLLTTFAMDKLQFKAYKLLTTIQEYLTLGLPLSFVMVDIDGTAQLGFVVGTGAMGTLIPFHVGCVHVNPTVGFTYFRIDVEFGTYPGIPLYARDPNGPSIQHHSIVNYGHLLPHLSTVDLGTGEGAVSYAVVTTDANYMNASYKFI
jgi:hypothetical protein